MKSLVPKLHESTFLCLLTLATLVLTGSVVWAAELKTNESDWLKVIDGAKRKAS